MKKNIRITATATVERTVVVDVPDTATSADLVKATAAILDGPDGKGSGEDLGNLTGAWAIIGVDPDSMNIDAGDRPTFGVCGAPPSDADLDAMVEGIIPK